MTAVSVLGVIGIHSASIASVKSSPSGERFTNRTPRSRHVSKRLASMCRPWPPYMTWLFFSGIPPNATTRSE